jgi:hypothetical protein
MQFLDNQVSSAEMSARIANFPWQREMNRYVSPNIAHATSPVYDLGPASIVIRSGRMLPGRRFVDQSGSSHVG